MAAVAALGWIFGAPLGAGLPAEFAPEGKLRAAFSAAAGATVVSAAAAKADEGELFLRRLSERLGPSDFGYADRIIGVSETGRGDLVISIWARRASNAAAFEARVMHDGWVTLQEAFGRMPPPPVVTVSIVYPERDEDDNVRPVVVGHVKVPWPRFRPHVDAEFSAEALLEAADTALFHWPGRL